VIKGLQKLDNSQSPEKDVGGSRKLDLVFIYYYDNWRFPMKTRFI